MRMRIEALCLMLAFGAATCAAQQAPRTPTYTEMYCSGIFTKEAVPYDTYLISGEDARTQSTFSQGSYVYINKGSAEGVKVGDEFLVLRPARTFMPSFFPREVFFTSWIRSEARLRGAMGEYWKDVGRIRVVVTQANTSVAQVVHTCDYLRRGDYVRPFAERPAPVLKPTGHFDRFAPLSGRAIAMVVAAKDFITLIGKKDMIHVNLGSAQGVKVGDYFRIFRYQGSRVSHLYQDFGYAYYSYGYGKTPKRYRFTEVPREVLGEGVVLRVSPTSSTVLVTESLREIFLGNYVELETPEALAEAPPTPAAAPAREAPKTRPQS
jgi:hypothetical protein